MIESELAFETIRMHRDAALADIGPRPPWWRPWARRRWLHERAAVFGIALTMTEMVANRIARFPPPRVVIHHGPGEVRVTGHGRKKEPS